ncbi:MAG: potassium-transporting ATPase subunit KdpA [Candidatus Krumholzibacteriales bacterium]
MITSILLPLIFFFLILAALVYILGEYLAWVFRREMDTGKDKESSVPVLTRYLEKPLMGPLERFIYRVCGIDPDHSMGWKEYFLSGFILNVILFVFLYLVFILQGAFPLNPDGMPGISWHLAFHNAATFVSNTNQQHYSGEISLSYFSQLFAVVLAMFLSAGTGMAYMVGFARGLLNKEDPYLGNFYTAFIKSVSRFLLPLSFLVALVLLAQGVPQTMKGAVEVQTLEGAGQVISRGPVAALEAIKMVGTNGGGFFGANAAHPYENPTPLTNLLLNLVLLAAPMAMVYAFGVWMRKRRHGVIILTAAFLIIVALLGMGILGETGPNPAFQELGLDQSAGNMEGKETRFGVTLSALWGVSTTSTTSGAVNSMHDSFNPLGQLALFLGMSMNCLVAGVGTGLLNLLTYVLICVFIGSQMVGRTPSYLGKRVEPYEIKWAAIIILLLPTLVLFPTSLALVTDTGREGITNSGYHGLSQIIYEYFSAAANNGSGFEGLKDNTVFYNLSCGIVILVARYLPILLQMIIAGSFARKKLRPETVGTMKVESIAFLVLFIGVLIIISGLVFIPAFALGPIAEILQGL